jgi:hypothetical protein
MSEILPYFWHEAFRKTYPQYSWILDDLDKEKYADVYTLIQRAVNPDTEYTTEQFAREFAGTTLYREIQTTNKAREVRAAIGTTDWDNANFAKFVSQAVNFGYQGDALRQEAYKALFAQNEEGKFVNPKAVKDFRQSGTYKQYQAMGKSYLSNVSDTEIRKVLTGEQTEEDFLSGLQETAKIKYEHLGSAIDKGRTLEQIAQDYKQTAMMVLEKSEDAIDMGRDIYEVALNFNDGKKTRLMTNGEWVRMLKTDSRYGWEKTENAKQLGRSIANNIIRTFQGA